jgi:hypothetical protein
MPDVDITIAVQGWHEAAPKLKELREKLAQDGFPPVSAEIVGGTRGHGRRFRITCRFRYASEAEAEQATVMGAFVA